MKKRQNNSARSSALRITFSVALISAFAILLAIAAPTNTRKAFGQNPPGFQPKGVVPTPPLGNYPFYATSEGGFNLVSIDQNTGVATTIGSFGYQSSYTGAFTPDGRFWTIINSSFAGQLAEVNLTTGQATPVGAPPVTNDWIIALDANPAGQLFAGSHGGRYYSVNTTTGQFTQIAQVGIYTCDFAFDTSGNLWAVDGGFTLYQLDPLNGALLNSKQMTGLAGGTMSIEVDPSNTFYVATTSYPA